VPYARGAYDNLRESAVPVPLLVRGDAPVESYVARTRGRPLEFHTVGLGKPADVTLRPFWQISYDRYNVYWDVITEWQWMYTSSRDGDGN
jgi:hypothetical protein